MQYRAKEKGWSFWLGGKAARTKSETDVIMRFIRLMDEFCRFSEKIAVAMTFRPVFSEQRWMKTMESKEGLGLCMIGYLIIR